MGMYGRIITVFAALFVLAACAVNAAPTNLGSDTVVATQGGSTVTLSDVDAYARSVPSDHRAELFASPERVEKIVRNLLAQKQLLAEAHKLKLQDDPKVAAEMQQAADAVLVNARINALRKKVTASVPDLGELAHERYVADPSAYGVPKKVDVKHILVSTKDRSDAEAKALAEKIYTQLKADPSQFDADVTKYSDDKSKTRNDGVIKNATSKDYVSEFREAADKLTKVGQILPPVKSQFGYHIMKLVKLQPARTPAYADVKQSILDSLRSDYIGKHVQHHLDVVRNRKIDSSPDPVIALRTRYADTTSVVVPAQASSSPTDPAHKTR